MAAQGKEAAKAETKATEAPEFYAFEFKLAKDKIGEKTTNPQIKSKTSDAFLGYGAFTESQVLGGVGQDRTVIIFFARLFEKGLPTYESLKNGTPVTIKMYDEDVELSLSAAKPSGGGATTGTSFRPKKEAPKTAGRGRGRGRGDKKDGEKKEGEAKDGEKPQDGGRGRGRGRGEKKDDKKESLARGRANIGGKLGPVSKVRLAKMAKEAREKENAERIARGEAPIEDKKKSVDDDDEPKLPAKGKKEAAKAGGKKEAGKAGGKAEAKAPAKGKGK